MGIEVMSAAPFRVPRVFLGYLATAILASACLAEADYRAAERARAADRHFGHAYSPVRVQRWVEKYRELQETVDRRDLTALARFLRDPDPWMAQEAWETFWHVVELHGPARQVDPGSVTPFGEYGVRNAQVDALDGRINADPKRASIIDPQEARSELEIALARMATYPDSEILDDLVRLGERQLIDGNKEALYLLRWFLDHEQLDLRANALAALLGCTRPDLCPDPPDKLVAGSYDADFIKRRTQEWLAWWRENEAVFQPKRFPPQWIR